MRDPTEDDEEEEEIRKWRRRAVKVQDVPLTCVVIFFVTICN